MKDQELLEQISRKMSVLIALAFGKDVRGLKTEKGVEILTRFGLDNQSVADILNTTKRTVEVIKSRIKKMK